MNCNLNSGIWINVVWKQESEGHQIPVELKKKQENYNYDASMGEIRP